MGRTGQPSNESGGGDPDETRTEYDWANTLPASAVVEAVAEAADTGPAAMDPLYEYIDPDALDEVVRPSGGVDSRAGANVTFTYVDYEVTVHVDGTVAVRPRRLAGGS